MSTSCKYIVYFYGLLDNRPKEVTLYYTTNDRQIAKAINRHLEKHSIYIIESAVYDRLTGEGLDGFNYVSYC